jgi:hypothetical protein
MKKLILESYEEFLNEAKIMISGTTSKQAADAAQKKFGSMLPSGMKFEIGKTPNGMIRLLIKDGSKMAFEFSTGLTNAIPNKIELTKDLVENALKYIEKYYSK